MATGGTRVVSKMTPRDDSPLSTVAALRERADETATRALVALLEHDQPSVRLEAARAIFPQPLPHDVRARVAAYLQFAPEGMAPERGEQLLRWVYACAAKAALEQPPERAFAEIASLLEANALGSTAGRVRAEKILDQLEEKLASCWKAGARQHDGALPDPRFVAMSESIRANSNDESVRFMAQLVIDGFGFLEGKATEPVFKHVELGEDGDPPFPFLIAGFPVPNEGASACVERDRLVPAGACCFHHQFGGFTCLHETFLGYGGWRDALGGPETFPALERGTEALLVSQECEPIKALQDLRILLFGRANAPWRPTVDLSVDPDVALGGAYTEAHDAALLRLGEVLGLGRPRIAYLWGNSD